MTISKNNDQMYTVAELKVRWKKRADISVIRKLVKSGFQKWDRQWLVPPIVVYMIENNQIPVTHTQGRYAANGRRQGNSVAARATEFPGDNNA